MSNSTTPSPSSSDNSNTYLIVSISVIGALMLIACCAMIGLQKWGGSKVSKARSGDSSSEDSMKVKVEEVTTAPDGTLTLRGLELDISEHDAKSQQTNASNNKTTVDIGSEGVNGAIGGAAVGALRAMAPGSAVNIRLPQGGEERVGATARGDS